MMVVPTNSILPNTLILTTCGLTYRYYHYFTTAFLIEYYTDHKKLAEPPLLHDGVILQRKTDMYHIYYNEYVIPEFFPFEA